MEWNEKKLQRPSSYAQLLWYDTPWLSRSGSEATTHIKYPECISSTTYVKSQNVKQKGWQKSGKNDNNAED